MNGERPKERASAESILTVRDRVTNAQCERPLHPGIIFRFRCPDKKILHLEPNRCVLAGRVAVALDRRYPDKTGKVKDLESLAERCERRLRQSKGGKV